MNVSYKLFMSVTVQESIENHLIDNKLIKENQNGFTKKGRIENNLLVLKYCIDNSFKNRKSLYVMSVDYAKAYDSVKRDSLINTLMDYKIHPNIIQVIAEIYTDDRTNIAIGDKGIDMAVTSGIRQGCTASTTLFKLLTYITIDALEKEGGYQDENFKLSALYYADDGLIMARTEEEITKMIEVLVNLSNYTGLRINKEKSSIIIFNKKE